MNTAVLYDACERAEAGSGELLAGRPLYSYSLKRFCFHSDIDSIAFVWRQEEEARQAAQYIEQWEKEYEIRKPVWILTGTETLTEALGQIRQKAGGREERKEIELFVFHDIRYPFVSEGMIYQVQQKASAFGLAVTAESLGENIADISGRESLEPEKLCCVKYPAAVRSDNRLLGEDEGIRLWEILEKIAEKRPCLCRTEGGNPAVYTKEDLEFAEALLKARGRELYGDSRA
ncbi:2-C-methyl-D-erythritol 4-phosphate cytidylyltransferase [Lachnospiraceae bacterium]|nr:2-C-methyl-D-erythritol 4-phosphate cytidylyltransferase [Lachnospiraceae bacterium]GFI70515.1 2-C-methyl-D-erythritol 4-phosphate cytidylyltransferase [Lachnospiraceae bacterium]